MKDQEALDAILAEIHRNQALKQSIAQAIAVKDEENLLCLLRQTALRAGRRLLNVYEVYQKVIEQYRSGMHAVSRENGTANIDPVSSGGRKNIYA